MHACNYKQLQDDTRVPHAALVQLARMMPNQLLASRCLPSHSHLQLLLLLHQLALRRQPVKRVLRLCVALHNKVAATSRRSVLRAQQPARRPVYTSHSSKVSASRLAKHGHKYPRAYLLQLLKCTGIPLARPRLQPAVHAACEGRPEGACECCWAGLVANKLLL